MIWEYFHFRVSLHMSPAESHSPSPRLKGMEFSAVPLLATHGCLKHLEPMHDYSLGITVGCKPQHDLGKEVRKILSQICCRLENSGWHLIEIDLTLEKLGIKNGIALAMGLSKSDSPMIRFYVFCLVVHHILLSCNQTWQWTIPYK